MDLKLKYIINALIKAEDFFPEVAVRRLRGGLTSLPVRHSTIRQGSALFFSKCCRIRYLYRCSFSISSAVNWRVKPKLSTCYL